MKLRARSTLTTSSTWTRVEAAEPTIDLLLPQPTDKQDVSSFEWPKIESNKIMAFNYMLLFLDFELSSQTITDAEFSNLTGLKLTADFDSQISCNRRLLAKIVEDLRGPTLWEKITAMMAIYFGNSNEDDYDELRSKISMIFAMISQKDTWEKIEKSVLICVEEISIRFLNSMSADARNTNGSEHEDMRNFLNIFLESLSIFQNFLIRKRAKRRKLETKKEKRLLFDGRLPELLRRFVAIKMSNSGQKLGPPPLTATHQSQDWFLDHSQSMTVAARATAERSTLGRML